ncbi:MAG: ABC transporter permease [Chloroflexi bacterium RBG_16_50_9]|nr:MAG: ABC transporter permease [Chloroflexi bacterium RBG_16_50_9]
MRRYVLKRVLLGIVTFIVVSMIVFIAARLSGDVALLLAPQEASEEDIQAIRVQLGLDKPIPVQYYVFMRNSLHGDFGESIRYSQPAMRVILGRLPATLELGSAGFLMSVFLGILFGVFSATRRDSYLDWGGKIFGMLGQSMPGFWVGIMLILLFGVELGWLPTSGHGGIKHLILPAFSVGWFSITAVMRLTRSSMLDVLDSEYIKMARIKGNPERVVVWKHALRNALIPVLGMAGMQLAFLIGGVVIVETVFRWPGLGSLIAEGVFSRDYSLVQAGVFIISGAIIVINLLVDLTYGIIDPRIKYE